MLARMTACQLAEWQAFYQVEAEDDLQAQATAQAQAGVAHAGPARSRRGFGG